MKKHNVWIGMMDLLFPHRCPFCGKVIGKELLCKACYRKLPDTGGRVVTEGGYGKCAAPLYYEDIVRQAILDFKFNGRTGAAECFGALLAECAAEAYAGEFDTVTWVPVSRKRLRRRGYDQAYLLARSTCAHWETVPVETLRKMTDTPPQSGIATPEGRRANVLGVYETIAERVYGRRILLIDDVLTTGATLGECVRVLREAGAAEVLCLTLARARGSRIEKTAKGHTGKVQE